MVSFILKVTADVVSLSRGKEKTEFLLLLLSVVFDCICLEGCVCMSVSYRRESNCKRELFGELEERQISTRQNFHFALATEFGPLLA